MACCLSIPSSSFQKSLESLVEIISTMQRAENVLLESSSAQGQGQVLQRVARGLQDMDLCFLKNEGRGDTADPLQDRAQTKGSCMSGYWTASSSKRSRGFCDTSPAGKTASSSELQALMHKEKSPGHQGESHPTPVLSAEKETSMWPVIP